MPAQLYSHHFRASHSPDRQSPVSQLTSPHGISSSHGSNTTRQQAGGIRQEGVGSLQHAAAAAAAGGIRQEGSPSLQHATLAAAAAAAAGVARQDSSAPLQHASSTSAMLSLAHQASQASWSNQQRQAAKLLNRHPGPHVGEYGSGMLPSSHKLPLPKEGQKLYNVAPVTSVESELIQRYCPFSVICT